MQSYRATRLGYLLPGTLQLKGQPPQKEGCGAEVAQQPDKASADSGPLGELPTAASAAS